MSNVDLSETPNEPKEWINGEVVTCNSTEELIDKMASCETYKEVPRSKALNHLYTTFNMRDTSIVDAVEKECKAYCEALDNMDATRRRYMRLLHDITLERDFARYIAEHIAALGDSKPLEVFKQEDEKMQSLQDSVFEKETLSQYSVCDQ
jgi:hypothetical protein